MFRKSPVSKNPCRAFFPADSRGTSVPGRFGWNPGRAGQRDGATRPLGSPWRWRSFFALRSVTNRAISDVVRLEARRATNVSRRRIAFSQAEIDVMKAFDLLAAVLREQLVEEGADRDLRHLRRLEHTETLLSVRGGAGSRCGIELFRSTGPAALPEGKREWRGVAPRQRTR